MSSKIFSIGDNQYLQWSHPNFIVQKIIISHELENLYEVNYVINFRKATRKDSLAIASIHVKSWQETYTNIFSDTYLTNLSVENRRKQWGILLNKSDVYTFVVEIDKEIIGFYSLEQRNYPLENSPYLASMYLLEKYHNKGIGKKMFFLAKKFWKEAGYAYMYLEVFKNNSTLEFYKKFDSKIIETLENKKSPKLTELLLKIKL